MSKIMKVLLLSCITAGTVFSAIAEASNIDTYRDLLMSKKYTIKYENVTPEERITNKDKITLTGNNTMRTGNISRLMYKPLECVVVSDGTNRYEEMGYDGFISCRLQNANGTYVFTKYNEGQGTAVWGIKKNMVVANQTNNVAYIMQGDAFGGNDMTRFLNAILPDNLKSAEMPSYRQVISGWLDNGLNYVDYRSDGRNMEAIRYYFNGYTLVKISSAQFIYDDKGQLQARRCIIKVNEFSPAPAKEYLSLPAGVKDATKKPKKDEGDN